LPLLGFAMQGVAFALRRFAAPSLHIAEHCSAFAL
jgi:hypothetical protein